MIDSGVTGRENDSRSAAMTIIPAENHAKPIKPDSRIDRSSEKLIVALACPTVEMKFNMGCTPFRLLLSLSYLSRKCATGILEHEKGES